VGSSLCVGVEALTLLRDSEIDYEARIGAELAGPAAALAAQIAQARLVPDRELKSFAPSMSKRTSCVPDGLVLLKVTADTARTSIKDECDSLCTCAVAVHPDTEARTRSVAFARSDPKMKQDRSVLCYP
jgi:hypothetical protein